MKKHSKRMTRVAFWTRHRRLLRWSIGVVGVLIAGQAAVWIAFQVSPWPDALLIRHAFEDNNTKLSQAQQKYVPQGITEISNRQYRHGDSDAKLDVFYPARTVVELPAIVWVHGGAWVSGSKNDVDNYLRILASYGFTTVSINYSIAPEKQYPTPILQVNDALGYVQKNARALHINGSRIVLAGDSAGSQIVAQIADIVTSPSYASKMGVRPQLARDDLKGLLLNCGAYDLGLPDYSGPFGKFLHTVLWAYSGTPDFLHDPALKTASVANYLTPAFPPAFITAGNVDPLLAQSTELAQRLKALSVTTATLFYPANHRPYLNHEYQFNLDTSDGQEALRQMIDFARLHTK